MHHEPIHVSDGREKLCVDVEVRSTVCHASHLHHGAALWNINRVTTAVERRKQVGRRTRASRCSRHSFPTIVSRGRVALLVPSSFSSTSHAHVGTTCTLALYRACRDCLCLRRLLHTPASHRDRMHGALATAAAAAIKWVTLQRMQQPIYF